NLAATQRATEYLIGLGHSRIGLVMGELDLQLVRDRYRGYQNALAANGLEEEQRLVALGAFTTEWGYEATVQYFSSPRPPTAILSGSLSLTQGTLLALRDLNLRIPSDVSVLAFDDAIWFRLMKPPITAIAQPAYRMGSLTTETLLALLEGGQQPPHPLLLETRFHVRQSCCLLDRAQVSAPNLSKEE
ncbi:MAG: LacI family transcriptional regulator, partial [Chloroflexi bacterium]|nr:LacI family transcriptional regulator [Chloroflexota bacterium]